MSEQVTRCRGAMRDDDGKLIPASETLLTTRFVDPGTSSRAIERARDLGMRVECIVYFPRAVDLTNKDELIVRGERYQIFVGDWKLGRFHGQEVICVRGEG